MYGYEIFHEELMKNLIESVHSHASSHAYIFEGVKGLGKLNAARLFAAALTCSNTEISPCGSCHNCIESKADTNPDIIYVRPKKDKKSIGADDMRKLEEDVAVKPFNANRKVYIIEDGSLLTEAAQNTFLKTFEEPPEYAVFILIIENSSSLLQTIMSRFTLINFPVLPESYLERYIEDKYPNKAENLAFLVKYCGGVPGMADSIINDEEFETIRGEALEKLFSLLSTDKRSAYIVQKYLDANKEKAEDIFDFWLSFVRDVIFMQTGAAEKIMNIDKKDILRQISSKYNTEFMVKLSNKIVISKKMLKKYVNIKAISMWISLKTA